MRIRYKKTQGEANASYFNTHALAEVLTGDDSAFISELDVWLPKLAAWKDMRQAFKDRDILPDNYNVFFYEPQNEAQCERGYL